MSVSRLIAANINLAGTDASADEPYQTTQRYSPTDFLLTLTRNLELRDFVVILTSV